MIGKFSVKSMNSVAKDFTENLGDVICDDIFSDDSDTRAAKATEFETFARNVISLTTNIYKDTVITVTQELSQIER